MKNTIIFSQNIGSEFEIGKCDMLIIKKRKCRKNITTKSGQHQGTRKHYTYLGSLETDTID